ncbi:hypothetical protein GN244_ATG16795 [Phytophthora infestans]|uniref:Uncharacterized protein n=1 Tax=Phytophthora infestans TaxID=4787 RepID=A0A833WEW4_PHYIN|nr:hypothetical protein GN244_ATG16795 [Phytophthora infestans]KAF4134187.1 hypothetical protein GN958_ATG16662 [Phytophthora infestans]KAI9995121.1 hypothetical protein PInf_012168 [Phytophthora infestans]
MPPALEEKDGGVEVTRGPECVDKVWDEQVDGAWAPGKAPVSLLTTFLKCVQERNSVGAERAAQEILKAEPNNRLVRDLLEVMKQHDAMATEAEEEGSDESDKEGDGDEEDDSDNSSEGDDGNGDEDEDDEPDEVIGADAKNND